MGKEIIRKVIYYFLFVVYIITIIYVSFLWNGRLGNQFGLEVWDKRHFEMLNLVPFATILDFVKKGWTGAINLDIVVRNLAANFFTFFPMGIVLPVLFGVKFDKMWKVLLVVFVVALSIEVLQFITFCGSADVDDLLLNLIGASAGYFLVQVNRKVINKEEFVSMVRDLIN